MPKFIKLHDYDNNSVIFNIDSIHAIYIDEKENITAIDYGTDETFFVKETVEEIESLLDSVVSR